MRGDDQHGQCVAIHPVHVYGDPRAAAQARAGDDPPERDGDHRGLRRGNAPDAAGVDDPVGGDLMRVLVACEESQAVCKAFRERGHEAYSCDIQECSGGHPEWHIKENCIPIIGGGVTFSTVDGQEHEVPGLWDLLIAHPPCTLFRPFFGLHRFRTVCSDSSCHHALYSKCIP